MAKRSLNSFLLSKEKDAENIRVHEYTNTALWSFKIPKMNERNGGGVMSSNTAVTTPLATSHVDPLLRAKVITLALYSRLTVIALAVFFDLILPNHDAGAFAWTPSSGGGISSPTLADRFVSLICDGLTLR